MHLVTVDTDVMLPGLLGRGRKRHFVFLLLLGAITARLDGIREETAQLETMAAETGAIFHPGPLAAATQAHVDARAAVLERLPPGAPDHWCLALSQVTFEEYLRKIVVVGTDLNVDALGAGIHYWRWFIALLICEFTADPFEDIPRYVEHDPADDHLVHTALLTESEWLITNDHHLVPRGEDSHLIESPEPDGGAVVAVLFDHFADTQVNTSSFDLAMVDSSHMFTAAHAIAAATD